MNSSDVNKSNKISGVGCGVVSCKFHAKDNTCCAGCITVGSTNAVKKGETYCETFEPCTRGTCM